MAFSAKTRPPVSEYFGNGDARAVIEDALNACYLEQPLNAGKFISDFVRTKYSTDFIEVIDCSEELDGNSGAVMAVRVRLFNGQEAVERSSYSFYLPPSGARTMVCLTDKDTARYQGNGMAETAQRAAPILFNCCSGKSVHQQGVIDSNLVTADGTLSFANIGANVAAAASMAVAVASAAVLRAPLFLELASVYHGDRGRPPKFHTPVPMFSLFAIEPKFFGKLRIREICIAPALTTSISVGLSQCAKVFEEAVNKLFSDDVHCPSVNPDGSLRYNAYDSINQAIDLAEECIKDAKLQPGVDIFIGIVAEGSWCYKADAQKYAIMDATGEVNGAQLAEFYAGLCKEKRSICYLEDTHVDTDRTEMRRLMSRVGNAVTVVGNNIYSGNPDAIRTGAQEMLTNAIGAKLNDFGTITNLCQGVRSFVDQYKGAASVVVGEAVETKGVALAHLATGIGARYFRCGGILRSRSSDAYNELLRIESRLNRDQLRCDLPPMYQAIALPPAPSEPVPEVNVKDVKKKK